MARKEKGRRRKVNREKVEKKAKQSNQDSIFDYIKTPSGFEKFKVEQEGKKRLDIIPYEVSSDDNPQAEAGEIWYERTFYVHKIPREKGTDTVVCPAKTKGNDCPICDYMKQQSRSPEADEEELKKLKPKERQLFNIVDKADPDTRYIWDVSTYLFGQELDKRIKNADEEDEYWNFSDVEDGKTLAVFFKEEKFGAGKFYDAETIDFKSRRKGDAYQDSDIDESADLDELLIFKTYEQLEKILHGEDEPEEKREKKKKKKDKVEKPSFTNPDNDESDFEDEDASAKKGKSGSKSGKKSKKKE